MIRIPSDCICDVCGTTAKGYVQYDRPVANALAGLVGPSGVEPQFFIPQSWRVVTDGSFAVEAILVCSAEACIAAGPEKVRSIKEQKEADRKKAVEDLKKEQKK